MPQQPVGPSAYFVVHNDSEYGLQIIIHGVAGPTGLKVVPRNTDLLELIFSVELWTSCLSNRGRIGVWLWHRNGFAINAEAARGQAFRSSDVRF